LHEATGDEAYLTTAARLAEAAREAFADGYGSFFSTAADAKDVPLMRPRNAADSVTPSGNGLMAENFARLFHLTGEPGWRDLCTDVMRAFAGQAEQLATMPVTLAAADLLEEAAVVAIIGDPEDPQAVNPARGAPGTWQAGGRGRAGSLRLPPRRMRPADAGPGRPRPCLVQPSLTHAEIGSPNGTQALPSNRCSRSFLMPR
jgi:uncharacterized protein YyaL (SSP411 family)